MVGRARSYLERERGQNLFLSVCALASFLRVLLEAEEPEEEEVSGTVGLASSLPVAAAAAPGAAKILGICRKTICLLARQLSSRGLGLRGPFCHFLDRFPREIGDGICIRDDAFVHRLHVVGCVARTGWLAALGT